MGWSLRVGVVLLVVCLGMSAAVGWGAGPPIREGGVLHVNVSDGVSTLDPAVNYTNSGWESSMRPVRSWSITGRERLSERGVVPEVAAALPESLTAVARIRSRSGKGFGSTPARR